MRAIGENRAWIDYTAPRFGVRVRPNSCRSIVRNGDTWEEYGEEFSLPLLPAMIDRSHPESLSYDLSMNVEDYEMSRSGYRREDPLELRAILLGIIDLNTAGLDM